MLVSEFGTSVATGCLDQCSGQSRSESQTKFIYKRIHIPLKTKVMIPVIVM